MKLRLEGKRVLVTGSSSGIGAAIAKLFAVEGAAVVVQGRNEKAARRVADEITKAGGKAAVALGDLADDAPAAEVAKTALAAFGGIDILVNNAGAFPESGWWDTTPAQWVELYNQNVASMVRMLQPIVPGMKERKWGRSLRQTCGNRRGRGVPGQSESRVHQRREPDRGRRLERVNRLQPVQK